MYAKLIRRYARKGEDEPVRVYLAVPYVAKPPHSKRWESIRFETVSLAAMVLIRAGLFVYSPISHTVPISTTQPADYNNHELWLGQDEEFLKWADVLVVLTLPGFEDSLGVNWERRWCKEHGIPEILMSTREIYLMEKMEGLPNEEKGI